MEILLLLVAILPGLLISFFSFRYDSDRPEPKFLLVICFLLGMFITLPAMKLESYGEALGWENPTQFWPLFLSSFVLVAFTEEFVKFACLLLVPYQHKAFDEPLDGIVYAVMIGMGFATLENILYAKQYGLETILFRAFTAVPAHGVFAVLTGYYAGLAKFDRPRQIRLLAIGFGLAVFMHGLYDFFILQEYYEWMMVLSTLTLAIGIFYAIKMIRMHRERRSQFPLAFEEGQPPLVDEPIILPEEELPYNDIKDDIFDELEKDDEDQP
ncbi:MAG: PrsW family glutamic-type intramembrane protease [Bacteroidota bacterium]